MVDVFTIMDTEEARKNYIRGLVCLSKATEIKTGKTGIEPEEYCFLENAMKALSLPSEFQGEVKARINSADNPMDMSFSSRQQALFFIREGIHICFIDGEYHEAEKEMINQMANELGISSSIISKYEEWVREGMEWLVRGDKLLEMED